jgi:5'-nucleotidase
MPVILVTNDDGISSPGIKVLSKTLESMGDVYVVAPETEQSAVAHALTLHRPLKFEKIRSKTYHVNGTPTDCVILGVNKLLPQKPDIIVSGINNGGNLGDDITYSGTVAAAIEGTLLGSTSKLKETAKFSRRLASMVLENGLPPDTLLNINIPNSPDIMGVRITKQGKMIYDNAIKEISDPRGREYFWIGGGIPQWETGENTDFEAIQNGYISITPVHLDLTNFKALKYMKENWRI